LPGSVVQSCLSALRVEHLISREPLKCQSKARRDQRHGVIHAARVLPVGRFDVLARDFIVQHDRDATPTSNLKVKLHTSLFRFHQLLNDCVEVGHADSAKKSGRSSFGPNAPFVISAMRVTILGRGDLSPRHHLVTADTDTPSEAAKASRVIRWALRYS